MIEPPEEQLARTFHNIYERLAPDYGYETRKETRDFDPTTPNGRLMAAVCREILLYHLPTDEKEATSNDAALKRKQVIADFVCAILHGDEVHRAWLRDAGDAFITGKPIPPPRDSKGKLADAGLNFVTLRIKDCNGDKIKIVPTMSGNLQVGTFAGIISVDEIEAIEKLRLAAIAAAAAEKEQP
jgi:hypothetical protein